MSTTFWLLCDPNKDLCSRCTRPHTLITVKMPMMPHSIFFFTSSNPSSLYTYCVVPRKKYRNMSNTITLINAVRTGDSAPIKSSILFISSCKDIVYRLSCTSRRRKSIVVAMSASCWVGMALLAVCAAGYLLTIACLLTSCAWYCV